MNKDQKKPSRQTIENARYGQRLSTLLWQKALTNSTPETRQLLIAWTHISSMTDDVLHDEAEAWPYRQPTNDDILKMLEDAEFLLTGYTHRVIEV